MERDDSSVMDHNSPYREQPGLWCQWVSTPDGSGIEWDGGEKFYAYVAWIEYLIQHFYSKWGYTLNGEVRWQGESSEDMGKIVINNNVVTEKNGHVVYE